MKRYVRVAGKGDLEPGTGKTVDVNGTPVALFNVDGVYHAIHNTCPHEDGSLGEGELSHATVAGPTPTSSMLRAVSVSPSRSIPSSGSWFGWRATTSWLASRWPCLTREEPPRVRLYRRRRVEDAAIR